MANDNLEAKIRRIRKVLLMTFSANAIIITAIVISLGNTSRAPIYLIILLIPLSIIVCSSLMLCTIIKNARMIRFIEIGDSSIELTTSTFFWIKEQTIIVNKNEMSVKHINLSTDTNSGNEFGIEIRKNKKVMGYVMDDFFEDYTEISDKLKPA